MEQRHLQAMGPTLGPLFHRLHEEVCWLRVKWQEFRKLYAHSQKRIDLLNGTAALFFKVVHDVIWQDVILHIARLTDPVQQGKYENLTFLRVLGAISDPKTRLRVEKLLVDVQTNAEFARQWRNKRLAHCDLSHATKQSVQPLPGVSRRHIENALASFHAVLNYLSQKYLDGAVLLDEVITHSDADALLYHLRVAAHIEKQKVERLTKGEWRLADVEPQTEE
ncbi:MAG: hypothetical protein M1453_09110 [Acidobacteria bacterium]|nr:hypothetical protein [Acidobacteriota bacterium]MCL5288134.1 hypothetical protein [Acidobacteriota bacterium]